MKHYSFFTIISLVLVLMLVADCSETAVKAQPPAEDQAVMSKDVFEFILDRSAFLAEKVLAYDVNSYVSYTSTSGVYKLRDAKVWTSGFVPGIFWYLFDLTGQPVWRERAEYWTGGLRDRANATDNDTGFQIFTSYGLGYLLTGQTNQSYKKIILDAARNLTEQRYNPAIGCYRTWDEKADNPREMPFEVNIDMLMNMELVLWVGQNGGPAEYIEDAISHADKTWTNNIRENGSSFHVVSYTADGKVESKRTEQGWSTDSTWSRGQAWAVYGYTMFYRYTKLARMLERAEKCYSYYMKAMKKQSNDYVPFSDFDAALDAQNPRDSSAAAIVAAAALELFHLTGKESYRDDAEKMLRSLCSTRYFSRGRGYASILLKGSERWGRPEVGAIFGDYYFIEALDRWTKWSDKPAFWD